VDRLIW